MKKNFPVTQHEVPFPEGHYIVSKTDLNGVMTYANDTFVSMCGFGRDELIGSHHNIVRHPDMPPQAFKNLWDSIQAGLPWTGIVKNRCKNGDHYWVNALAGRLHLISIFFNNPENPHSLVIKQSRELSSQTQTEFARRHWLLLDYVED